MPRKARPSSSSSYQRHGISRKHRAKSRNDRDHYTNEDVSPPPSDSETTPEDQEEEQLSDRPSTDRPSSRRSLTRSPSLPHPEPHYTNVAPLPIFRGTPSECPVAHLTNFSKVCRANNISSSTAAMLRIFPVTLEGEAALWYDLNVEPYIDTLSWEETRRSFMEAYNGNARLDHLRAQLVTLRQGREETVRSYFVRLQWLLKLLSVCGGGEVSGSLVAGVFVDGLREDFRDWVVKNGPAGRSVTEALEHAFEFEREKSVRALREKVLELGLSDEKTVRELWGIGCEGNEGGGLGVGEVHGSLSQSKVEKTEKNMMTKKKSMSRRCQCSKHRCWKNIVGDRNISR